MAAVSAVRPVHATHGAVAFDSAHGTERAHALPRSVICGGRTMRSRGLPVRMRHRIATWMLQNVPFDVRNAWASALGLSTARVRNAVTESRCEGAPITAEMILFLPDPYRSGLLALLAEWGGAIDRGEL